jgi:hypothetical protein
MDHSFQRLLSNAEHCPATPGLSAIVQALSKQNRKQQALLSLALPTSKLLPNHRLAIFPGIIFDAAHSAELLRVHM